MSEYERKTKALMCSLPSFILIRVRVTFLLGLLVPGGTKNYPHPYYLQTNARMLEYFLLLFSFSLLTCIKTLNSFNFIFGVVGTSYPYIPQQPSRTMVGKLQPMDRIQSKPCFHMTCELRMAFTF